MKYVEHVTEWLNSESPLLKLLGSITGMYVIDHQVIENDALSVLAIVNSVENEYEHYCGAASLQWANTLPRGKLSYPINICTGLTPCPEGNSSIPLISAVG